MDSPTEPFPTSNAPMLTYPMYLSLEIKDWPSLNMNSYNKHNVHPLDQQSLTLCKMVEDQVQYLAHLSKMH